MALEQKFLWSSKEDCPPWCGEELLPQVEESGNSGSCTQVRENCDSVCSTAKSMNIWFHGGLELVHVRPWWSWVQGEFLSLDGSDSCISTNEFRYLVQCSLWTIVTLIISTEYLWECRHRYRKPQCSILHILPQSWSSWIYPRVYPSTAQSQNDRGCAKIRAVDLPLRWGKHNLAEGN